MFSKWDKAFVAAAVSFGSLVALQFFGVEVPTETQAAIVAVVTGVLTFLVPNKA